MLPRLAVFKTQFYLAGGTALALQIGHRTSVDFDFFTPQDFDTAQIYKILGETLEEANLLRTQEERNTLSIETSTGVKLSFLSYPYPLLDPLVSLEHIDLAALTDIGCMKFAAILSRSQQKDYVDLYVILQRVPLARFAELLPRKFSNFNVNLAFKSLVYLKDIEQNEFEFRNSFSVTEQEMAVFFEQKVKQYYG